MPANLLNENCVKYLNYHENIDEVSVIENDNLATFTLGDIERDVEGKLIVPIMWDSRTSHLLSKNYFICNGLLQSNLHKLQKTSRTHSMVNQVFKEQLDNGIIERITDLPQFMLGKPQCSFLGHMPIFK